MSGNVEAQSYPEVIKERLSIEVTTRCNINCSALLRPCRNTGAIEFVP